LSALNPSSVCPLTPVTLDANANDTKAAFSYIYYTVFTKPNKHIETF